MGLRQAYEYGTVHAERGFLLRLLVHLCARRLQWQSTQLG